MVRMSDHDNPPPPFLIAELFLEFHDFKSVPRKSGKAAAIWVFADVYVLDSWISQLHFLLNQKRQPALCRNLPGHACHDFVSRTSIAKTNRTMRLRYNRIRSPHFNFMSGRRIIPDK